MLLAPVPVGEPAASAEALDDPLIIDVDDDPTVSPAGDARDSGRTRPKKKSPRMVAVPTSAPDPDSSPTPKPKPAEPRPPERRSERPNDLFPPSD